MRTAIRRLVSVVFYPAVLALGLAAGMYGLSRGVASAWIFVAINVGAAAVISLVERWMPYRADWNRPQGDVAVDLAHTLISTPIVPVLARALLLGAVAAAGARLSAALGMTLWPTSWPLLVQLPLALVVAEFGQYWVHRLAHETGPLWRLHALHHSAGRLYWLNTSRFHPLDTLLQFLGEVTPLVLLGAGESLIVMFGVFTALNGGLRHANVDMRLGPLSWVLSTADLHRWHHSRVLHEANANYGANVIVWDVLFGTRRAPTDHQPAELGLADGSTYPAGYVAQLAAPFRRAA